MARRRDWGVNFGNVAIGLALVAIGSAIGTSLTIEYYREHKVNWDALSALLMAATVALALLPIHREQSARLRKSRALRALLYQHVDVLEFRVRKHWLPGGDYAGRPFGRIELDAIAGVEAVAVNADLLDDDEFTTLHDLLPGLSQSRNTKGIGPELAQLLHMLLFSAKRTLSKYRRPRGVGDPLIGGSPPLPPSAAPSPPPPTPDE